MSETLEIPVEYNNQELLLKANIIRVGYVHHIVIEVDGYPVTIERDEEGSYRALVDEEKLNNHKIDKGLIEAALKVLEEL